MVAYSVVEMAAFSHPSLEEQLLYLVDFQNREELTVAETCNRSLCALNLFKIMPISRFSLQNFVYQPFQQVVDLYVLSSEEKMITGEENVFPPKYPESYLITLQHIVKEIKYLILFNKNTWALYFMEWSLHLATKLSNFYTGTKLRLMAPEDSLNFWKECPATVYIMDVLRFCISQRSSSYYMLEVINMIISTITSASPQPTWVLLWILEDLSPHLLAKTLLQNALFAFSSKFQTASYLLDLIVLSVNYLPNFSDELTKGCHTLFLERLSDHLHPVSLCSLPFLLHLATCVSDSLVLGVPDILNQINTSVESLLLEQSKYRDETLQLGLIPKLVNVIMSLPDCVFIIIDFLLHQAFNPSLNNLTCKSTYLLILGILADKIKDLTSLKHITMDETLLQTSQQPLLQQPLLQLPTQLPSSPALLTHVNGDVQFLRRLSFIVSPFLDLLLIYRTSPVAEVIFSILVSVGMFCGLYKMSQIITLLLLDQNFIAQHHYMLIEFTGSFQTASAGIATNVLERIVTSYYNHELTETQFLTFLNNLWVVMMAERQYMGENYASSSYRHAFLHAMPSYFKVLEDCEISTRDALLKCALFFEDNFVISRKQAQSSYQNIYSIFSLLSQVLQEIKQLPLNLQIKRLESVLKLATNTLKSIFSNFPSMRFICFQFISNFIVQNNSHFNTVSTSTLHHSRHQLNASSSPVDDNILRRFMLDSCTTNPYKYNQEPHTNGGEAQLKCTHHIIITNAVLQSFIYMIVMIMAPDQHKAKNIPESKTSEACKWDTLCTILLHQILPGFKLYLEWPDEDEIHCYRERDLKITNAFEKSPPLRYAILLIASREPQSKSFIIIVRSIMASILSRWDSSKASTAPTSLIHSTRFLFHLMFLAGWLDLRFTQLPLLFEKVKTPRSVYAVMSCLWAAFKHACDEFVQYEHKSSTKPPPPASRHLSFQLPQDFLRPLDSILKSIIMSDIKQLYSFYRPIFAPMSS